LVASVALLAASAWPAVAASPQVEAAVKAFAAVEADAAKLATLCDMFKRMEAAEAETDDKKAQEIEKEIDAQLTSLGPEFNAAWELQAQVEAESDDGKAYYAAADQLAGKCPK
jgi:hypothetical protein